MKHGLRGHQFVEIPQTTLSSRHQPCLAEIREMARGSWLGNAENRHQIADAQLSMLKQM
jgi:hypothetical protein